MRSDDDRPIEFTDRELKLIARALPENADERRLALFPEIMRDWGRTDLPRILRSSADSAEVRKKHCKRFERIDAAASKTAEALAALDNREHWDLITELARSPEQSPYGLTATNLDGARSDLEKQPAFLRRLSVAAQAAGRTYAPKRGPAPTVVPYLVLRDLAAIFEWVSGIKARRRFDPSTSEESGPFHGFAAAVWPPVFGSDDGLSNGLKQWAANRRKYGSKEKTAVLANVDLRHPEWGIFRL